MTASNVDPKTAARAAPQQQACGGLGPPTADAFAQAPRKAIALFGMSGVGKTVLSTRLRKSGEWFHYSVDYRIGTRYLDEPIVDLFKREAMKSPLLREMLLSDSVRLESNIQFENLAPLSAYLGQPGDPHRGGLAFDEYVRRQRLHRDAESMAMLDAPLFMEKAEALYGYPHFLCDTSGSLVEVVDPFDDEDPILSTLSPHFLFVYIRGEADHEAELVRRFEQDPKPIYYNEAFLRKLWSDYQAEHSVAAEAVDPNDFARFSFKRLIRRRAPLYQALADRWGVTLAKDAVADVRDPAAFLALIEAALRKREALGPSDPAMPAAEAPAGQAAAPTRPA
ncbi:MAG: ATPase [Pseudomonadota bacterium]